MIIFHYLKHQTHSLLLLSQYVSKKQKQKTKNLASTITAPDFIISRRLSDGGLSETFGEVNRADNLMNEYIYISIKENEVIVRQKNKLRRFPNLTPIFSSHYFLSNLSILLHVSGSTDPSVANN